MAVIEAVKPGLRDPQLWPLSVQAYRTLGDLGFIPKNTELLYGQVFKKMSKSPLHSAMVRRLLRHLRQALPAGCILSSEQPITCADHSEPEPDAAVVRGAEDDFWTRHPSTAELAIEVCVTSHDYDRSKLQAYAAAEVKEVWLILVPEKRVEVHLQPKGDRYSKSETHGPGGTLSSATVRTFSLDLDRFFRQ